MALTTYSHDIESYSIILGLTHSYNAYAYTLRMIKFNVNNLTQK